MADRAGGEERRDASLEPDAPRRLCGLWIICVLFGLTGAFILGVVFLATALGATVFGGLALLSFGLAVGLWLRSNAVRIVVMVLLALGCMGAIVPIACNVEEFWPLSVLLCISLGILAYLWSRRRHFEVPAAEKPRRVRGAEVTAFALVVLVGTVWTLLLTVDDAPEQFPRLEARLPTVPEDGNAYPVLLRMMEEHSFAGDDELERVIRGERSSEPLTREEQERVIIREQSPEPLTGEDWARAAADVVQRYEPCFKVLDELLSCDGFVAPVYRSSMDWETADNRWLGYCRALAWLNGVRTRLAAAQGRAQDGLDAAGKTIDFGLMISETPNAIMTCLVGRGVLAMGLEGLREAAGSDGGTVAMLLPEIRRLDFEDALRRGIERAFAAEFVMVQGGFDDIKRLRTIPGDQNPFAGLPLQAHAVMLKDPLPFLKTNMSRNFEGNLLDGLVTGLDRYHPHLEPAPDGPFGTPSLGGRVTWLHFLRNPVGDVLVTMESQADAGVAKSHFQGLADLRLTRLFLALRCYDLEHGNLPASLDELVPGYLDAVPVDPFTEAPFHYEPGANPPCIWSVGPDQQPDSPDAEHPDDVTVDLSWASGNGSL